MPAPDDKELTETAMRLLKDKEQVNGIYDRITEKEAFRLFSKECANERKKAVL